MAALCNPTSPPLEGLGKDIWLITGAVLAGGHSSRFGSNKALQPFGETTFLGHAIGTLRPICQQVVISASARNASDYAAYGLPIIPDDTDDCGPLGGIVTLLRACTTPWLLILTCDMPWLTTASLRHLLEPSPTASRSTTEEPSPTASRFSTTGQAACFDHSPLPLLIHRSALPTAEAQLAAGHLSIKALLAKLSTRLIPRCSEHELANVNRPSDLPHVNRPSDLPLTAASSC